MRRRWTRRLATLQRSIFRISFYDKSVLVEYSGIAADSSLTGRVLLNNTDIGAQMIRDGAAWFDHEQS